MFGIVRAPDLDRPGLTWFNVAAPPRLADLAGRLVILDFWTFCCVNCFHVQPILRRIEEAFATEVVVIGVHSPKFAHEREPRALEAALARYDIRHPVAHDPALVLWEEYCVRAWPTLVLISPDGRIIGQLPGEPHPDRLVEGIGDMVAQFWSRGELTPTPPSPPSARVAASRVLRYPGKIKPCPGANGETLWAVADSGHHQVVVVDDYGGEVARYGDGAAGFEDGEADLARFNGPEGLVCDATSIWVADTRNHAIRRVDRVSGKVTTVAGNGCRGLALGQGEPGQGVALASPWDLALVGGVLYFANAGSHQICSLAADGTVRPVAGSGAENISDGAAMIAELAQPSGLAACPGGKALYFADSESSAVRRLVLGPEPRVETLVGTGLFDFGHTNGSLAQGRLQHPLGLAAVDGRLFVADSYNSSIRVIDLAAGSIADLAVPADLAAFEPAGIAADGPDRLLVSDTNNHRIVEMRLAEGISRTWMG